MKSALGLLQQLCHQGRPTLMSWRQVPCHDLHENIREKGKDVSNVRPLQTAMRVHKLDGSHRNFSQRATVKREESCLATSPKEIQLPDRVGNSTLTDVSIVIVIFLQGFDDQIINGKPNGASPIRISSRD